MAAPPRRSSGRIRTGARLLAGVVAGLLLGPALLGATSPSAGPALRPAAALWPDPGAPVPDAPPPRITVADGRLVRDGVPWVPRGVNLVGLLTPAWCDRAVGVAAREHLGPEEFAAARDWGADMLRFQVSQRGLADPAVAESDRAAYLAAVVDGVAQARAVGFAVVVSMQDQFYGCGDVHPLPSAETVDAWRALLPALTRDPGVMLELFNEPRNDDDAAGWAQWRSGGSSPDPNLGEPAVGHQQLVEAVRRLGSTHVLVADTARLGERSAGIPLLDDPLDRLAYGIHPYHYVRGERWWDRHYGDLAGVAPVLATEWNFLADGCGTEAERLAPELLAYLHRHGIGVVGHAFDVPGTTVADWSWAPTRCGTDAGGSGALLRSHFRSLAAAED